MNNKSTTAIYVRTASTSQKQSDNSRSNLEIQKKACQSYCIKRGLKVLAIFEDSCPSVSNVYQGREALLDLIEAGSITDLVILDRSRWSRDKQGQQLLDQLIMQGTKVHIARPEGKELARSELQKDLNSAMDRFERSMRSLEEE